MPAPGELTYYQRMQEGDREHARNKPFSDDRRGALLMEVGAVVLLLKPPPCRVLECGCGAGWLTYLLAKSGYDVVGQDVNAKAIELARENPLFTTLPRTPRFLESDFERLHFRNEFDAVVFFDSLHHSLDMPLAIGKAFDALKPGGILIASEPGAGHARHSREFAQEWGVTDRDAPPSLILALGRAAGFARGRVCPHAGFLGPALYQHRAMSWPNRIARVLYHTIFARRNGIVVLEKGTA
jgi:SAM-dependent methyltransferase